MDAVKAVKELYTLEELKEIADHGCQSGVCSQHIYYGDTVQFYDTYEADIIPYFIDNYDVEFLVDLFKESLLGGDLTIYKNNVCWAFIESVAFTAVDEEDERLELEDAKIAEYMQPVTDDLAPARLLDEWNNSFELYQSVWFSY